MTKKGPKESQNSILTKTCFIHFANVQLNIEKDTKYDQKVIFWPKEVILG